MALLLDVEDLSVGYESRQRGVRRTPPRPIVSGIDLRLEVGASLALAGESGSGKSTTAKGILGLLPLLAGRVEIDGHDVTTMPERRRRKIRSVCQMVFQDPYSSLDPSMSVGEIVSEPLRLLPLSRAQRLTRIVESLESVGLTESDMNRYAYEFSGGQRQRIAIARALAPEPKLIVCDEATSALDVSTQNQVLDLLDRIRAERGLSYLFVSHNLPVVNRLAENLAIMYCGQIVEQRSTAGVFAAPAHPYTYALLSSVPRVSAEARTQFTIPGEVPHPSSPPSGCRFRTRCPFAMDICTEKDPEPTPTPDGGTVRCHLHTEGPGLAGASIAPLVEEHLRTKSPALTSVAAE